MSKNRVYYRDEFVIGVGELGEIPGADFLEVEGSTAILQALNAGMCVLYQNGEFITKESKAKQWLFIRESRDVLLKESDVQLMKIRDGETISGVASLELQALAKYRQALRDITLQPDPFNIEWPIWSQK
jgi:hypothetical protein